MFRRVVHWEVVPPGRLEGWLTEEHVPVDDSCEFGRLRFEAHGGGDGVRCGGGVKAGRLPGRLGE